jgi:hypothetical protein
MPRLTPSIILQPPSCVVGLLVSIRLALDTNWDLRMATCAPFHHAVRGAFRRAIGSVRHVFQMLVYVVGIVGCSDTHCGVCWLVLSIGELLVGNLGADA